MNVKRFRHLRHQNFYKHEENIFSGNFEKYI